MPLCIGCKPKVNLDHFLQKIQSSSFLSAFYDVIENKNLIMKILQVDETGSESFKEFVKASFGFIDHFVMDIDCMYVNKTEIGLKLLLREETISQILFNLRWKASQKYNVKNREAIMFSLPLAKKKQGMTQDCTASLIRFDLQVLSIDLEQSSEKANGICFLPAEVV